MKKQYIMKKGEAHNLLEEIKALEKEVNKEQTETMYQFKQFLNDAQKENCVLIVE